MVEGGRSRVLDKCGMVVCFVLDSSVFGVYSVE